VAASLIVLPFRTKLQTSSSLLSTDFPAWVKGARVFIQEFGVWSQPRDPRYVSTALWSQREFVVELGVVFPALVSGGTFQISLGLSNPSAVEWAADSDVGVPTHPARCDMGVQGEGSARFSHSQSLYIFFTSFCDALSLVGLDLEFGTDVRW